MSDAPASPAPDEDAALLNSPGNYLGCHDRRSLQMFYLAARSQSQSGIPGVVTSFPQTASRLCLLGPLKLGAAITVADVLCGKTARLCKYGLDRRSAGVESSAGER